MAQRLLLDQLLMAVNGTPKRIYAPSLPHRAVSDVTPLCLLCVVLMIIVVCACVSGGVAAVSQDAVITDETLLECVQQFIASGTTSRRIVYSGEYVRRLSVIIVGVPSVVVWYLTIVLGLVGSR